MKHTYTLIKAALFFIIFNQQIYIIIKVYIGYTNIILSQTEECWEKKYVLRFDLIFYSIYSTYNRDLLAIIPEDDEKGIK